MIRALWTAASGMLAQQLNVDTISNNIANVNTTAYKKDRVEFKDLIYETLDKGSVVNGEGKPVNLQVGHGVRPAAITKSFEMGNLEQTGNPLDLAIDGEGFFAVKGPKEEELYTRDGSFKLSVDGDEVKLVTSEGYPVLGEDDQEIVFSANNRDITVSPEGVISVRNSDGTMEEIGKLKIVKFANPEGLEKVGSNLYRKTSASGEPVFGEDAGTIGNVVQGFLETSNVQVVEEMVKLIVAQRAYEINSKSIQTADEMLNTVNNLRR